jgi:hypothetical protein
MLKRIIFEPIFLDFTVVCHRHNKTITAGTGTLLIEEEVERATGPIAYSIGGAYGGPTPKAGRSGVRSIAISVFRKMRW